ncbi:hypothetical protein Hanom_Chr01g00089161 [Helianthus anomalus]
MRLASGVSRDPLHVSTMQGLTASITHSLSEHVKDILLLRPDHSLWTLLSPGK